MKYRSELISFQDILPIWQEKLWKGRNSPIKPMSSMLYKGGFNMDIYNLYSPTFFAVYNNANKIIGVNSGHRTNEQVYRSRGIWVDPLHRKKGIAGILFCELEGQAMKEKCTSIWSIPREEALPAYIKYGFVKSSNFFDEDMEFGPNCYVRKKLDYELKQH